MELCEAAFGGQASPRAERSETLAHRQTQNGRAGSPLHSESSAIGRARTPVRAVLVPRRPAEETARTGVRALPEMTRTRSTSLSASCTHPTNETHTVGTAGSPEFARRGVHAALEGHRIGAHPFDFAQGKL